MTEQLTTKPCMALAHPVELFTILDNGYAQIMVFCPVCEKVHFIEDILDVCRLIDSKDVYGNPVDLSPMHIVCSECEAYAAAFIPEQVLTDFLKAGHLEIHKALVRMVAEPGCILPVGPLNTPDKILSFFLSATHPGRDYYYFELPDICRIILDAFEHADHQEGR